MESTSSANKSDYLFLELFDRYVRRVADKCDLPQLTSQKALVNKIDVSPLTTIDQQAFEDWLSKRFYLRISIENALRRGMLVKVNLASHPDSPRTDYTVQILGQ